MSITETVSPIYALCTKLSLHNLYETIEFCVEQVKMPLEADGRVRSYLPVFLCGTKRNRSLLRTYKTIPTIDWFLSIGTKGNLAQFVTFITDRLESLRGSTKRTPAKCGRISLDVVT